MTAQNARLRRCGAALLCLVCAAVMVRSAFVGLEIDEEYALSLGFRLVSGDRLFYSMWEPHQLSSLPSAALLAAFMAVTGGTTIGQVAATLPGASRTLRRFKRSSASCSSGISLVKNVTSPQSATRAA